MVIVDVLLLGPVAVAGDNGVLSVGGEQQLRLLAAMASEVGRVVPLERLHAILWPEGQPTGATGALYSYVSRLRRSLGRDVVVTSKVGYGLSSDHVVLDSARFERLIARARSLDPVGAIGEYDEALRLWRGPAYGAFTSEWWAHAAARRLEELRLVAMSERVAMLLALDRADEAAADTELLVELDPLRESFVQLRMVALHTDGRSAQAMQTALAFRRRLVERSGLDPSPGLSTLERRIADNDPRALTRPPRSLRGYELEELIADGTTGAVYAAAQHSLDRRVAIKVVHRDRADEPTFVRRFETEARLVARLEHPCIVPLYDYWREPGAAYLVFRLLRGGTLRERLVRSPLTLDELDAVVERIGDALVAAHRAGVAHRDVCADNVLYDDAQQPFLTGFGIAAMDATSDTIDGDVTSFVDMLRGVLVRTEIPSESDRGSLESILRRGVIGEIVSIADLTAQWRTTRRGQSAEPAGDPFAARSTAGDVIANPFKGLRPFTEIDRDDFFGRSTVIDALDTELRTSSFVCVVGSSGSGKSSIVLAGLVPLQRDRNVLVTTMTPGRHPLSSLGDAIRRVATERQVAIAEHGPAAMLTELAVGAPALLVIDQLEELWGGPTPDERRDFTTAIIAALEAPGSQLRVVATLRADFYGDALADPILGGLVHASTFPVLAMNAIELVEAVTQPIVRLGLRLEPGLDARIVSDVLAQPGGLPLMQSALATLFDERAGSVVTNQAYDALGGVAGSIAFTAEGLYLTLDPDERVQVRGMFGALISPKLDGPDVRRRARRAELSDVSASVLDRLHRARLITFDRDSATGEPTVEVSHESMFLHWPRLRGWIEDDRHDLVEREAVRDAAAAWDASGRDPSHLLRGARLSRAEGVDVARLDDVQRVFVAESGQQRKLEHAKERHRLRRTQGLLAGTALLLVAALVGGGLALTQRSQARHAEQQANGNARRADTNAATAQANADRADKNAATAQANAARADQNAVTAASNADLASKNAADATASRVNAELREVSLQARTLAHTQPDLALLLAAEVAHRLPGPAANDAVLATLIANPAISRIVDIGLTADDNGVGSAAAAASGPLVVSTHVRTLVVDRATLTPTGVSWPHPPDDAIVSVNSTGTEAVTVTNAGVAERHDPRTGDPVGPTITVTPTPARRIPAVYLGASLVIADGSRVLTFAPGSGAPSTTVDFTDPIIAIAASSDSTSLAVLTSTRTELVDVASGQRRPLAIVALSAAFSGDNATLYLTENVGAGDLNMLAIAVGSGSTTATLKVPDAGLGAGTIVLDTGQLLITSTFLGASVLVDGALSSSRTITGSNVSLMLLPWPNGHAVASLGRRLVIVDTTSTPAIATQLGFTGFVQLSADGSRLAANDASGTSVRDARTLQPIGPTITDLPATQLPGFEPFRLAISPDGTYVAGTPGTDPVTPAGGITVRMYSAATGRQIGAALPAGTISSPSFSPDGKLLAIHTTDGVGIFSVPDLTLVRDVPIDDQLAVGINWSPDSTELTMRGRIPHAYRVTVSNGDVTPLPFGHWDDAYSPDSTTVASAGLGPIDLTTRATGAVTQLSAFSDWTLEIAFVPGTTWLERKTNTGWELIDTQTQTLVGDKLPLPVDANVGQGEITPDGSSMIVTGDNTPALRVDLDPAHWVQSACAVAGRNLTSTEWTSYFGLTTPYHATCPQYP